jgi:hypothetical protein
MVVLQVLLAQLELGDQQGLVVCKAPRDHKAQLAHKDLKVFKEPQAPQGNLEQQGRKDQADLLGRKELPELWVYRV